MSEAPDDRVSQPDHAPNPEPLRFALWLAVHDAGFGNGVRSRALQKAARLAALGDPAWREVFAR
jgi:hypothetical protein